MERAAEVILPEVCQGPAVGLKGGSQGVKPLPPSEPSINVFQSCDGVALQLCERELMEPPLWDKALVRLVPLIQDVILVEDKVGHLLVRGLLGAEKCHKSSGGKQV